MLGFGVVMVILKLIKRSQIFKAKQETLMDEGDGNQKMQTNNYHTINGSINVNVNPKNKVAVSWHEIKHRIKTDSNVYFGRSVQTKQKYLKFRDQMLLKYQSMENMVLHTEFGE